MISPPEPWAKTLTPNLPRRVTRQVMAWFAPRDPALFTRSAFRCSCWKAGTACITASRSTTVPGVKIAKHHHADETVDPDDVDRNVSAADEALIRAALADHIPAANGARMPRRPASTP